MTSAGCSAACVCGDGLGNAWNLSSVAGEHVVSGAYDLSSPWPLGEPRWSYVFSLCSDVRIAPPFSACDAGLTAQALRAAAPGSPGGCQPLGDSIASGGPAVESAPPPDTGLRVRFTSGGRSLTLQLRCDLNTTASSVSGPGAAVGGYGADHVVVPWPTAAACRRVDGAVISEPLSGSAGALAVVQQFYRAIDAADGAALRSLTTPDFHAGFGPGCTVVGPAFRQGEGQLSRGELLGLLGRYARRGEHSGRPLRGGSTPWRTLAAQGSDGTTVLSHYSARTADGVRLHGAAVHELARRPVLAGGRHTGLLVRRCWRAPLCFVLGWESFSVLGLFLSRNFEQRGVLRVGRCAALSGTAAPRSVAMRMAGWGSGRVPKPRRPRCFSARS